MSGNPTRPRATAMVVQHEIADAPPAIRILWPEVAPEDQDRLDHESAVMAERKAKVFRLYTRGMSCRAIAEQLAAESSMPSKAVEPRHYSTISRYVKEIFDNYRLISLQDAASHTAAMLARLDQMEVELWAAWDRSKGEFTEQSTGRRQTASGSYDVASVKKKQRLGEPKLMALIQGCWDRRCKLLGLMKAEDFKAMNGMPPVKIVAGMAPEDLV